MVLGRRSKSPSKLSGRAYANAMREEIAKHIIQWRRAAKETNRNSGKTPFYFSLQITSLASAIIQLIHSPMGRSDSNFATASMGCSPMILASGRARPPMLPYGGPEQLRSDPRPAPSAFRRVAAFLSKNEIRRSRHGIE
jgi:hypothetical protein